MNSNNLSKSEVAAIVETYEGLIRQGNANVAVFAKWTEWKAVLAGFAA